MIWRLFGYDSRTAWGRILARFLRNSPAFRDSILRTGNHPWRTPRFFWGFWVIIDSSPITACPFRFLLRNELNGAPCLRVSRRRHDLAHLHVEDQFGCFYLANLPIGGIRSGADLPTPSEIASPSVIGATCGIWARHFRALGRCGRGFLTTGRFSEA